MVCRQVNSFCLAALFFVLSVSGQNPSEKPPQSELEVIRTDWKYSGYSRIDVVQSDRSLGAADFKVQRGKEYGFKYTATVVVRNNGTRAISQVDWLIVFTDHQSKHEVKAFKARSKIEIKPAQTILLERSFYLDKDVNLQALDRADRTTVVSNIEYAEN